MAKFDPKKLDPFISLKGQTLVDHFSYLDDVLWKSLCTIAQDDPKYLQRCMMGPIIRQLSGTSHGRRWYVSGKNEDYNGYLVDTLRQWVQKSTWRDSLYDLDKIQPYRDSRRQWVEDFQSDDYRVQDNIDQWLHSYYHIRGEITKSYLPLVWSIAASYGFTEDSRADLFQVGITGLIHATERYHNVGPLTFSSFAGRWIRQRILMNLNRTHPLIRVSHSVLERLSKLSRAELQSGEKDESPQAHKIRSLAAAKDVVLTDDVNTFGHAEIPEDSLFDFSELPQDVRRVMILKYEMFNQARPNHTPEEVEKERWRQLACQLPPPKDRGLNQ